MNNSAIITRVNVRPHPNADRLQLANTTIGDFQVIVGLDVKSGDLGIVFPEGLQLSNDFAKANDLIRRKDADGKPAGGMFDENRRVRCQKFRGEKSEAFWIPIKSLEFTKGNISTLKEGEFLTEFNGVKLCQKYITPATRSGGLRNRSRPQTRGETLMFKKHFDTPQMRVHYENIPVGSKVIFTLKIHGTSNRVGRVLEDRQLKWYEMLLRKIGVKIQEKEWKYLIGSRNVILNKDDFREKASLPFIGNLHKGECVFFEICGYENENTPIMGRYTVTDKELQKKYGSEIVFHYGCQPGQYKIYVYRITRVNEDGNAIELTWDQVKGRCKELGVEHVPEFYSYNYELIMTEPCVDDLKRRVEHLTEGVDPIGKDYPREGVCIRAEHEGKMEIFKNKSFEFKLLEGLIKDREDYVDTEEAA